MSPETDDPNPDHLRLVEALLFASAAPLDEESIAERLPDGTDVAALIAALEAHYDARGVNLVRVANGWTFRTAPDLGSRLKLERKVGRKLSRAAVETLAIVAYHQPVTRAEIEDIRGVIISKGTLDTLMEAGWIMPKGRKETVGRPVTWVTTDDFLIALRIGRPRRPARHGRAARGRTDRPAYRDLAHRHGARARARARGSGRGRAARGGGIVALAGRRRGPRPI